MTGTLHEYVCACMISRSFLRRIWNVSDESCRENQNTQFMFGSFTSVSHTVYEVMWKNMVDPRQATWQYKTAHALFVLVDQGYRHTLRICNSYCFSTETLVSRTRLSGMFTRRRQLKCDGTRWRTGWEVKGKLVNGVGSQYPSHYLGTWCIQHYYRWCAHLGCQ